MTLGAARRAAEEWVAVYAEREPGFRGAYFIGSTVGLADDESLPVGSDLDLVVVTADDDPPLKPGKLRHSGVLLEVTLVSWQELADLDRVSASYHLAWGLHTDTIFADPTGQLRGIQAEVARRFNQEEWVWRRCADARGRIESNLAGLEMDAPWHDIVTSWLFGTGVMSHVLLVAGLRNPTIRLRYRAVREMLVDYGESDLYPRLLALQGGTQLRPQKVAEHVGELARTFDLAAAVARTPFFFTTDISSDARSLTIDASEALIAAGDHAEALFWIVATFARCQKILYVDAPELCEERRPAFDAVLADLGIRSCDDVRRRAEDVLAFVPTLWAAAGRIIARNRDIRHPA